MDNDDGIHRKRALLLSLCIARGFLESVELVMDPVTGHMHPSSGVDVALLETFGKDMASLVDLDMDLVMEANEAFEGALRVPASESMLASPHTLAALRRTSTTMNLAAFRVYVLHHFRSVPILAFVKPDGTTRAADEILQFLRSFPRPRLWRRWFLRLVRDSKRFVGTTFSVVKIVLAMALMAGKLILLYRGHPSSTDLHDFFAYDDDNLASLKKAFRRWSLKNHPDKFAGAAKIQQEILYKHVSGLYTSALEAFKEGRRE